MSIYNAYTYIIKFPSLDLWYYGVRSLKDNLNAEDDLGISYFSSSYKVQSLIKKGVNTEYIIHKRFKTIESAFEYENKFLKTAEKIESVKRKMLNCVFGGFTSGYAAPNKDSSIYFDRHTLSTVRTSKDKTQPRGTITRKEYMELKMNILGYICLYKPLPETLPLHIRDIMFRSTRNGHRSKKFISFAPKEIRELYCSYYNMDTYHKILDFMYGENISINVIRLLNTKEQIKRIIQTMGIYPDFMKQMDKIKEAVNGTKVLNKYINGHKLKHIGAEYGFSESRASQILSEERKILDSIDGLETINVQIKEYEFTIYNKVYNFNINSFKPMFAWMDI